MAAKLTLSGDSASVRRLFAPPTGLPDRGDPIGHHGVQGQVLAITAKSNYKSQITNYKFRIILRADRCAPVSSSIPDRNAQNIRLTEMANGPYTSAKLSRGRAKI